jgi:hypothetical protein
VFAPAFSSTIHDTMQRQCIGLIFRRTIWAGADVANFRVCISFKGSGTKHPQGNQRPFTSCAGGTGARSADAGRCANRRAQEVPVPHVDKPERGDLSQPKPRGRTAA